MRWLVFIPIVFASCAPVEKLISTRDTVTVSRADEREIKRLRDELRECYDNHNEGMVDTAGVRVSIPGKLKVKRVKSVQVIINTGQVDSLKAVCAALYKEKEQALSKRPQPWRVDPVEKCGFWWHAQLVIYGVMGGLAVALLLAYRFKRS
jgi:hypothetical protein